MDKPLVSVIIATYNWSDKRLSQTIESVLNQTYKNIEIIIINDASTNDIEDVILWYKKKYNNIIYLRNEKNSERSYSRNRWIFESKWKYLAFCDDDDIWNDKDKIKKQVEFLESHNDYVLCWTSMIEIDEENKEIKRHTYFSWDKTIRNIMLQWNPFALSSVILKKNVLLYSWLFNWDFNTTEDYDLRIRIGRYGKLNNLSDSFIYYRTRQGNTSTTQSFKQKRLSFKSMCINNKYYPNFFKALICRIMDFTLPENFIKILVKIKNFTRRKY